MVDWREIFPSDGHKQRTLEAVRKLKPFKINGLAANELAREKPGNGFHARRQKG
jgi:hypothetical protein